VTVSVDGKYSGTDRWSNIDVLSLATGLSRILQIGKAEWNSQVMRQGNGTMDGELLSTELLMQRMGNVGSMY
jgi:hypothetical protein